MTDIEKRLDEIRTTIAETARAHGREADAVRLVAVSKRQPTSAIRAAFAAGQRAFGENYVQEALEKCAELDGLPIEWHFIGALQSNKTADVARRFDWVHTVDRARIAKRLDAQRPDDRPALNVLIQVNISAEASKHGVTPKDLGELAAEIEALPRLALRGLMALPAPEADFAEQRAAFAAVRELARGLPMALDHLSMGTTQDFRAAIAEGATLVRLGTAVFGPRPPAA